MGRFKPRRGKAFSYKQLNQIARAREAQRDDLIGVIGGLILEHGEIRVEVDLMNMAKGMKLEVVEENDNWKKMLVLRLREADGTLYTLENTGEADKRNDGGQGEGTGVQRREDDVRGPVLPDEPRATGGGSTTESLPPPEEVV